jgi:hypothetical protein
MNQASVRQGLVALRRLLELAQLLEQHRQLTRRRRAGIAGLPGPRELQRWIAEQQQRLRAAVPATPEWSDLARTVNERLAAAAQSERQHIALIAGWLDVAERVSDEFGLAGDAAAQALCGAIDGLRTGLRAPGFAIQAQFAACYRSLEQLERKESLAA